MNRYKEGLKNQLLFIESSSNLYDSGIFTEVIRIAVSLRVIFHSTASLTSLLKHSGVPNKKMITELRVWPPDFPVPSFIMPFRLDTKKGYIPYLGESGRKYEITAEE